MRIFLAIFISLLFLACSPKTPQNIDLPSTSYKILPQNFIQTRYNPKNSGKAPQNLDPFISQNANDLGHFPYKIKLDERRFLKALFKTWNEPLPSLSAKNKSAIFWGVTGLKRGFDENGNARKSSWFKNIKENADIKSYASIAKKGITTDISSVRLAPSDEALFPSKLSSEQNNFDDLQESVLGAFSPVMVSHFSKDKKWAFVRTDAFWGWMKAENLMILEDNEASEFFENKFAVFIKDDEKIQSPKNTFISRIGGIFPYTKYDKKAFYFNGKIGKKNYDFKIDFGTGSHFLQVNDANLKSLANTLIGQEYGWGGMRNLRDCSLFVKDYFAVFGKYLPRNSQSQGNVGGKTEIFGSSENRKNILKNKALLMTTLLVMPGHVMLYAGNGEVIHNVWGIRTQENGRAIIGKTAITDLETGKGYENIKDSMLLLNRIKSLNVVIDPLKIAIENAYNVQIGTKIRFDDGYTMQYQNPKANHNSDFYSPSTDASVADMLLLDYPLYAPLNAPRNDAGRIRANEFFNHIYGENESEVEKNLVAVTWLKSSKNQKIMFNSKNGAAAALQRVSDELDALSKKNPKILKHLGQGGTFKWRKITKSDNLSPHSWAIALDIDVENSSYWQWHKEYKNTLPKEIVDIFERNGFIWGGRWEHFDTMHFEYRPEYIMLDKLKEKK